MKSKAKGWYEGLLRLGCLALGVAPAGCSAAGDGLGEEAAGTSEEAIHSNYWRNWSARQAPKPLTVDAAICSNHVGYFVVARTSVNLRYTVKRWFLSENPDWKDFGTKEFYSAPSCTMQIPNPPSGQPIDTKFIIAGKASDNRIWAIEGVEPAATNPVPPNPDWTGPWAQVSSTQFPNTTDGRPAVASSGARIALVYINGNRLYARYRNLPYATNSWNTSGAIAAPQFPSGVTVTGIPAITWLDGTIDKYVVLVRGTTSSSTGVYWIYFANGAFQGTSWNTAFVPYTVNSDLAVEWDYVYNAMTLYWRAGEKVFNMSARRPEEIGVYTAYPIPGAASTNLDGAPRVTFRGGIEGIRAVVIRGYDNSVPAAKQNQTIMLSEVFGVPDPFAYQ